MNIGGQEVPIPYEGETLLELVIVMKVLDEDGDPAYRVASTNGVLDVEALAMLLFGVESAKHHIRKQIKRADDAANE